MLHYIQCIGPSNT